MLLDDAGATAGIGVLVLIALYFLPTIVALMRKRPAPGSVIVVNLFLGWTFIGWIVALAMAFGGSPAQAVYVNQIQAPNPMPNPMPAPPPLSFTLSADSRYWWDGARWIDADAIVPPMAMRSPDGAMWWDTRRWRAVPQVCDIA